MSCLILPSEKKTVSKPARKLYLILKNDLYYHFVLVFQASITLKVSGFRDIIDGVIASGLDPNETIVIAKRSHRKDQVSDNAT